MRGFEDERSGDFFESRGLYSRLLFIWLFSGMNNQLPWDKPIRYNCEIFTEFRPRRSENKTLWRDLKACISKLTKENDFPDKLFAIKIHTHNLVELIKHARLKDDLEQ